MMQPRDYQTDAMAAVHDYLCTQPGNPCVVLPTGAGKTPTMAWMIQNYMRDYPYLRVLVLAHVRELLSQGIEKMQAIWPDAPVGVYSAGLKGKDRHAAITYAGIQSIWRHAARFAPWDLIFVDEAHRIPIDQDATYCHFLGEAKVCNPALRIVGWTATPYRLDGGAICGPDRVLTEVCFDANVKDLIDQGYLCSLRTKSSHHQIDVRGVHVRQGDFVTKELAERAAGVVGPAVDEAVQRTEGRKAVIFFCINVAHAYSVSERLAAHGIVAPVVHAGTPPANRKVIVEDFVAGRTRVVCNVNVLSEGFDATRIDCVALMRPTASPGLFYQQVGRGLRLHEEKKDCLILDFSGNTLRHGPIDRIRVRRKGLSDGSGESPVKTCPDCEEVVHAAVRECPGCGHEFPAPEPAHDTRPTEAPIISGEAGSWTFEVESVAVKKHNKPGKPPSLKVTYFGGLQTHSEWVCLEHDGFAGAKGKGWWRRRFGDPIPQTVDEALASNLFLASSLGAMTKSVKVKMSGKYTEVVDVTLRNQSSSAVAH